MGSATKHRRAKWTGGKRVSNRFGGDFCGQPAYFSGGQQVRFHIFNFCLPHSVISSYFERFLQWQPPKHLLEEPKEQLERAKVLMKIQRPLFGSM